VDHRAHTHCDVLFNCPNIPQSLQVRPIPKINRWESTDNTLTRPMLNAQCSISSIKALENVMPNTHRRCDETVELRRVGGVNTSLSTDSVDNLETDQTDSIAFDYTNFDRY